MLAPKLRSLARMHRHVWKASLPRWRDEMQAWQSLASRGMSDGPTKPSAVKTKKTYYDILEITIKAKPEAVKDAYRRLAKKYHPDKNMDDPEAEARFKQVQEAHATLSDKWKRAIYDQDLQFGSMSMEQEVDTEQWMENFNNETSDEREARRERYRRYARGERNDLPPDPWPLKLTPAIFLGVIGLVFYVCVRAPDWFDGQSDETYCDPAFDDKTVPLVLAYHDPVIDRWMRISEADEPPRPAELYSEYERGRPDIWKSVDPRRLPRSKLTVMSVPRTETVLPKFKFATAAA